MLVHLKRQFQRDSVSIGQSSNFQELANCDIAEGYGAWVGGWRLPSDSSPPFSSYQVTGNQINQDSQKLYADKKDRKCKSTSRSTVLSIGSAILSKYISLINLLKSLFFLTKERQQCGSVTWKCPTPFELAPRWRSTATMTCR